MSYGISCETDDACNLLKAVFISRKVYLKKGNRA